MTDEEIEEGRRGRGRGREDDDPEPTAEEEADSVALAEMHDAEVLIRVGTSMLEVLAEDRRLGRRVIKLLDEALAELSDEIKRMRE